MDNRLLRPLLHDTRRLLTQLNASVCLICVRATGAWGEVGDAPGVIWF
jgi:hypothetical protein